MLVYQRVGVVGNYFFFACAPGIWEDVGVCESDFRIYLLTGFGILIGI